MINKTINHNIQSDEEFAVSQLMQSPFVTGSLIVNFSQNQITLNGKHIILQPKVLELLIILCTANGRTLSKQELIDRLWADTVVGPDSLANTMTRLRKALNDAPKKTTFIKTVQRKGYLWLPNVESVKTDNKLFILKASFLFTGVFILGALLYFFTLPKGEPKKFPFPDLTIKKLDDGGYEIDVGIEGELTAEKEKAMLKELKRITGEESSDMVFTIDEVAPKCEQKTSQSEKQKCETDINK